MDRETSMSKVDIAKKVTVVIPNYNGIRYIEACLRSLKEGTVVPQIIVVDNASTDGSRELIEEKFPEVLLLKLKANTGFCHAVNCGIHLTKTKYVILLNNDIEVDPHFVEEMFAAIAQSGRIFSAQAKMLSMHAPKIADDDVDADGKRIAGKDARVVDDAGDLYCALGWAFGRGKGKRSDLFNREQEIFSACAGAAIYRMSVLEKIGLFDERHFAYLEDVDLGYRAQIYGYRNIFAPKAIVLHAGSATSGSVHNPFKERMTAGNNYYLLYKNMPAVQYAVNAPLIGLGIAIKKGYFGKKGLGEAYQDGLTRGKYLRAITKNQDWLKTRDYFYKKRSIPEEAGLTDAPEGLEDIMPLYLGGKVPFEAANLPNYLRIQGKLWANTIRRFL